ncbi:MAG: hypothetical protein A3E79_00185 [Burkholderiales bacterium RIFCSPHIGHO2_12_FULL_61_11]|nr:MAG: hypothetical protein A3E79_00185 [Burkholderiales bacterium RIFCSPHIGHO2_12_FULL_61_11]
MIKPTTPYDDRAGDQSRDFAAAGKFSLYALERMLRDCSDQPQWRLRAKLCAAYYDGKQLTELQRWHIRQEELEERAINLIRPVINSVLGQEAKSRTDVKVESDDDSYADVAEVISAKLKEAERETRAHMAVSDAYASMVKTGIGWVHVSKNSDPLAYPYRVESVHRDEIWWDWMGQTGPTLLDGCRWLVRKRMVDLDEVEAAMPEHRDILRRSVNGWEQMLDYSGNMVGEPDETSLRQAFDNERRFNLTVSKRDWVDAARKMIKLYEVWYRVQAVVVMMHLSPVKKVEYDEKDPRHVEAVARGLVKLSKGITSQVRRALYAGPYRLLDEGTRKRNFPYIPFFAFRDDDDKSPYGLIDGMISPQDDFNERHHRIQWMLKARQIQMDGDALDPNYNTIADIADAVMRPDMVMITNAQRANKQNAAIKISNDLSMQPEQFKVQADSKQYINDTTGRYGSQLGSAQVQSGIANSMLIEQGEQSMGEMNDNYTYGRRAAFEELVCEISYDLRQEKLQMPIGTGRTRRVVILNTFDPQGMPVNQVKDADIRTALAETPNTPAFRQQAQQQLASIITALGNNPKATAILAPAYMESTSIPNRQQVADDLRKANGLPMPGDKTGQAQAEAMQQQAVAQEQEAAKLLQGATVAEKAANAERHKAAARASNASAALIEQRIAAGVAPAEVDKVLAETERLRNDAANEDTLIADSLAEAEQDQQFA